MTNCLAPTWRTWRATCGGRWGSEANTCWGRKIWQVKGKGSPGLTFVCTDSRWDSFFLCHMAQCHMFHRRCSTTPASPSPESAPILPRTWGTCILDHIHARAHQIYPNYISKYNLFFLHIFYIESSCLAETLASKTVRLLLLCFGHMLAWPARLR